MMKKIPNLDQLKKVKKVEAPPFLLTRINAKIMANQAENLPTSWKWAGALAFGLMICLNIFGLKTGNQPPGNQIGIVTLADGLQMSDSNQLYYE